MDKKRSRNVTIDFLRFLFSVIVVLHHSRYVLGDAHCYFLGGSLAVEFFFFVSGYLLLVEVEKRGPERQGAVRTETEDRTGVETLHFLFHKIKGFLPEFLIAWGIGFLVIGAVEKWSLPEYFKAFEKDFWELSLVKMSGLFTGGINGAMWYLSAMLLGMAVLYPLLLKKKDLMTHLVCPLLALFLYGYLCRVQGHPRDPIVWLGLCYKGLARAVAGLCVGIVCRMAAGKLRRSAAEGLTGAGELLVILLQLACLVLVIRYMALRRPTQYDYFYLFLLMLLVLLSFSGFGLEELLGGRKPLQKAAAFLGKYSLSLYLGHLYFAQHINEILPPEGYSGRVRMAAYLALAFANGFAVMTLAGIWRRRVQKDRLRSLFIR